MTISYILLCLIIFVLSCQSRFGIVTMLIIATILSIFPSVNKRLYIDMQNKQIEVVDNT